MSFSSNYCSDFSQSNKIISNTEKKDNLYDINIINLLYSPIHTLERFFGIINI